MFDKSKFIQNIIYWPQHKNVFFKCQVESRYGGGGIGKRALDIESLLTEPSTQQMQQALDSNVDQITTVTSILNELSITIQSNFSPDWPIQKFHVNHPIFRNSNLLKNVLLNYSLTVEKSPLHYKLKGLWILKVPRGCL